MVILQAARTSFLTVKRRFKLLFYLVHVFIGQYLHLYYEQIL
jgi:hypothetical protein